MKFNHCKICGKNCQVTDMCNPCYQKKYRETHPKIRKKHLMWQGYYNLRKRILRKIEQHRLAIHVLMDQLKEYDKTMGYKDGKN